MAHWLYNKNTNHQVEPAFSIWLLATKLRHMTWGLRVLWVKNFRFDFAVGALLLMSFWSQEQPAPHKRIKLNWEERETISSLFKDIRVVVFLSPRRRNRKKAAGCMDCLMRIKEQFGVEKQQSETRAEQIRHISRLIFHFVWHLCTHTQEKALLWRE